MSTTHFGPNSHWNTLAWYIPDLHQACKMLWMEGTHALQSLPQSLSEMLPRFPARPALVLLAASTLGLPPSQDTPRFQRHRNARQS